MTVRSIAVALLLSLVLLPRARLQAGVHSVPAAVVDAAAAVVVAADLESITVRARSRTG